MSVMTYAMIQALQANKAHVNVLDWTLGGTTYRYARDGINTTNGPYKARVQRFGTCIIGGLSLLGGRSITEPSQEVTLKEKDSDITKIVRGENSENIVGSTMLFRLAAEDVDPSSWFTWCSGDVMDFGKEGTGLWTFVVQPNVEKLKSRIRTPILSEIHFDNLSDDAAYKACPLIFGKQDSAGTGRAGLLPTLHVDTVNHKFLVALGPLPNYVTSYNVWANGVSQTDGVDYNMENYTSGDTKFRLIDFVSSPTLPVTCDHEGVGLNGGGSVAYENLATQAKILLAYWVFNSVPSNSSVREDILTYDEHIDKYSFNRVAAFLDRSNATFSRYVEGDRTGEEIINEMLEKANLFAYWSNEGKITLAHCDWIVDDIYSSGFPIYTYGQKDVAREMNYRFLTEKKYDEVAAKYLLSTKDGDYLKESRVKDPDAGFDARLDLEFEWSRAKL